MSKVDVIVPCYKYAHFLKECVESVLTQSLSDLRVLIIDDASPDHTAEVAADLVAQDPRVHFVRHPTNQGHIATYNKGLDWAVGKYTVLLSADDLLTPGSLARAAAVMDDHPGVGLVYGRGIEFQSDGPAPELPVFSGPFGRKILAGADLLESFCATGFNKVCTPTTVVRTCLQKRLGGYRKELPHTGDMEMWMRFAAHADVAWLDTEQACYRLHAKNMSSDWYSSPLAELIQRKSAFDSVFDDHPDLIKDASRLRTLAYRNLASQVVRMANIAFDAGELPTCREMLDFALGLDTELPGRREWIRLSWKLRMGPQMCAAVRPVVRLTRQARALCLSERA